MPIPIRISEKSLMRIDRIVDRDGYAEVNLSNSRKYKDTEYDNRLRHAFAHDSERVSDRMTYCKFYKNAYEKLKGLKEGDLISNIIAYFSNEPYVGDVKSDINRSIDLLEKAGKIAPNSISKEPREMGVCYPEKPRITVWNFDTEEEFNAKNEKNLKKEGLSNMDKPPVVETSKTQQVNKSTVSYEEQLQKSTPTSNVEEPYFEPPVNDDLPF